MKPLFGAKGRRELREFARSNVLLGFDFDGTLAPIVRQPDVAKMRAPTAERFQKVCELYPCGVISGRARSDVSARVAGAKVTGIVGNHGLETSVQILEQRTQVGPAKIVRNRSLASMRALGGRVARSKLTAADGNRSLRTGTPVRLLQRRVKEWADALTPVVARFPGLWLEDKGLSLSIHFRGAKNPRLARAALERDISSLGPLRQLGGKQILNLLPPGAPNKGDALVQLRDAVGAETAIYFGDDTTDEDVFAMADDGRLLPIRVGRRRDSHARYFIPRQTDIDAVLDLLISERQKHERAAKL